MAIPKRRVSYVIPPPPDHVPRLKFPPLNVPRYGSPRPLIISQHPPEPADEHSKHVIDSQPRHRLGVMALALDSTTQLEGLPSPGGILYTGGRDGQVISWDLGLPLRRKRNNASLRGPTSRWERLTGMAEDPREEGVGEEEPRDGDILGDVKESGGRRWKSKGDVLAEPPYEHRWEVDSDAQEFGAQAQFRQCVQLHTDWVNDILLCNYNQAVISASSDGTVKSWMPHSGTPTEPSTIGLHTDYVRCLALSRERNWVASGSFDRTIKLWDLTRSSTNPEPLVTLNPPDSTASKASIYALAAHPYGHIIASGSPERVVRMWDPRAGKRIGKLVGHTDNIRAILISEDARYLLTGSADASIKLWSLFSQRCLHTFTYHTDSVWSLHSSHPSLEVFYSGDKSGIVCKVDVGDCGDIADGACIVLSREPNEEAGEGVNKIVTADDDLLWTASGSSSVNRWKLPRRLLRRFIEEGEVLVADSSPAMVRRKRVSIVSIGTEPLRSTPLHQGRDDDLPAYSSVPLTALVRLVSPNGPYSPSTLISRGRDAEVATLYSAASIVSVPGGRPPFGTAFQQYSTTIPSSNTLRSMRSVASMSNTERELSHDPRVMHVLPELASDAEPYNAAPDSVMPGSHGLLRAILLNDRMHALTVDTKGEVAVWDIVRGICRGKYTKEDVRAAGPCGSTNSTAFSRGSGSALEDKERSPRKALEIVRERIEGEAVISPWSSVDTKTGVLTVHINERWFEAEIYADEAGFDSDRRKRFGDEQRLNIGKWVLRSLFQVFIQEEQHIRKQRQSSDLNASSQSSVHRGVAPTHVDLDDRGTWGRHSHSDSSTVSSSRTTINTVVITSPSALPAVIPDLPAIAKPSPLLPLMIPIPLSMVNANQMPLAMPQSTPQFDDRNSMLIRTHGLDIPSPPIASRDADYLSSRSQRSSTGNVAPPEGDVPLWSDPSSPTRLGPESPTIAAPNTGRLMGRLKNFGKAPSRKPVNEAALGSPIATNPMNAIDAPTVPEDPPVKTPAQLLLSDPISPPPLSEVPQIPLPPNITVMISDEYYPGWKTVYREDVWSMQADIHTLEETMPLWLLEFLLFNRAAAPPNVKISFVLLPWPNPDPNGQLPELLNTAQSKLTASRFLRVRKLTHHVQEKLEKISTQPGSGTVNACSEPPLPTTPNPGNHRSRAEEVYEILCNDSVLSLDMTLAAVRQYFWKQSSELTMHYRLRRHQPA